MIVPVMIGDTPTPEIPHTGVVNTPTDPVAEEVIEAVAFENVLDLEAGKKYKLRPLKFSVQASWDEVELRISHFSFGSLEHLRFVPAKSDPVALRKCFSVDTPKVSAIFTLNPMPYKDTLDGQPMIGLVLSGGKFVLAEDGSVVNDEIVIEIKRKIEQFEGDSPRGRRSDPFTYHIVNYEAVAIENLTNPDRKFEYE